MPHVKSVNIIYGLVVKRLRHRPFTAVSGVRVPSRSPKKLHFCSFLNKRLGLRKMLYAFFGIRKKQTNGKTFVVRQKLK